MNLRNHLVLVAEAYGAATGLSLSRISTIVLNGGSRLPDIASGRSDITLGKFEDAMRWFSANWPADAAWPDGVARPFPESAPAPPPAGAGDRGAGAASSGLPGGAASPALVMPAVGEL